MPFYRLLFRAGQSYPPSCHICLKIARPNSTINENLLVSGNLGAEIIFVVLHSNQPPVFECVFSELPDKKITCYGHLSTLDAQHGLTHFLFLDDDNDDTIRAEMHENIKMHKNIICPYSI